MTSSEKLCINHRSWKFANFERALFQDSGVLTYYHAAGPLRAGAFQIQSGQGETRAWLPNVLVPSSLRNDANDATTDARHRQIGLFAVDFCRRSRIAERCRGLNSGRHRQSAENPGQGVPNLRPKNALDGHAFLPVSGGTAISLMKKIKII